MVPFLTVSITLGKVEKFSIIDEMDADIAKKSFNGSTVNASFQIGICNFLSASVTHKMYNFFKVRKQIHFVNFVQMREKILKSSKKSFIFWSLKIT